MEAAKATFPRMGARVAATFSLPAFHENFDAERGVTHAALSADFNKAVSMFLEDGLA